MDGVQLQEDSSKSPEYRDFAKRLSHWRQEAGIKKVDFARMLGVEPPAVSKWEAGQTAPTLENLHKIAKACGITLQIFWGRIPEEEA